jgi:hypothetical protein
MSLGTLTIDIAANLARLESDLGKANRLSAKFAEDQRKRYARIGKLIGGAIATFATGAFAGWIKESIDAADAAAETAQTIGISIEAYQGLSFAASTAGVEQEGLTGALTKFNKTISQAAAGGKKQAAAFADIGVSVRDANGNLKTADGLLLEVADKFQGYADGANKTALAQDLFGKSGAKLIPLLNSGKQGITDLMTQAQRLGLVMSAEAAAAADTFNDNLTVLSGASRGMANNIATGLLPALNDIGGLMLDLADNSDTAADSGSGLGTILKAVTAIALALGTELQAGAISLAGFAAAAVQAASGDFAIAGETLKAMKADIDAAEAKGAERIEKLFDGTYAKKAQEAAAVAREYAKELKRLERQNAEAAAAAAAAAKATAKAVAAIDKQVVALQEQAATVGMTTTQTALYKLAQDGANESQLKSAAAALAVVDAYDKSQKAIKDHTERVTAFNAVQESTFTDGQKLLDEYQTKVETLRKSLNAGDINQTQYDNVMDGLDKGLSKAQDKLTETKDVMSVFADEAARNAQDAFANFLFDPFADGVDGMAANFGKVLQRMVAEAAAAQLMQDALGKVGADGERTGGFLSAGLKAASTFFGFGGGKAVGGPVEAGKLYEVGENDAPEMFMANGRQFLIPGNSGSIKPQGVTGGRSTQVFNITTPDANSFRASQRQIARRAKSQMSQT